MPVELEPMLAVLAGRLPQPDNQFGFEFKWDGIRAIAFIEGSRIRLQTRNRKDVTARYPELQALAAALDDRQAILDGEIVALDERGRPSFEQLQRRMGLTALSEIREQMRAVPVVYMIFDVVYLDGRLLVGEPYTTRRRKLRALRLKGPHWQTPPQQVGHGPSTMQASLENGLEGVVAKRLDSRYEPGRRSGAWLKVKNRLRQELVIGGWVEGEGRRRGLPGAVLVGYYAGDRFVYAGKVGSGFTEAMLRRLGRMLEGLARPDSPFDAGRPEAGTHFVEPRLVAEFEFAEWTRAGDLRAPSFKGLREDKDARDVVREVPREPGR